jgi:ATP-binding cassette subfamily F protein 3
LKSELKQTERAMSKESEELAGIERKLADEETYQGLSADEIQDLLTLAARQRKRTEDLENKWLKLSDELETLQDTSD